ncbi:hypothetical protein [Chryseobacterium fistulae]|uniref:Uncharacterized protein n=1 Tax=Chryseobacterium fistulae TaxID=2675058 RepID=A0A6N4XW20_9FLAO|nr:hypothetical protein [Chryseobacterium fistulae]CAA7392422.1 hypothetical protein CHRY9393_03142 [Chryseobacterium fistulae]
MSFYYGQIHQNGVVNLKQNELLTLNRLLWSIFQDSTPKQPSQAGIHSKVYEKGEKATKLAVEVLFNEKAFQMFLWFPNSQIEDMNLSKDEEENRVYIVKVPQWIWEKGYSNAIEKQLDFYNKDESKYSKDDFTLISKVENFDPTN